MDVPAWLKKLGLEDYAAAFVENGVDAELLSELTNEDLKDLGVARLADRKRLLKAIEQLVGESEQEQHEVAVPVSSEAERRQLTVMFCDLVGSTALSTRLDPEDYREVIRAYQDACAGVITRYDGYLAKFMGDGVLAYYGWPRAHEDDAERAISTALGIVESAADLTPPPGEQPLAVRIGIATGPVVVGDIVGEGAAQEAAVTGETPNLAARLQEIAEPNTIVIATTTHALAGGLFAYDALGGQSLKGIDGSTDVWRVVSERRVESRFAAAHSTALTPLIGREEELELLSRRWEQAKGGEGQVVLLSGEPGIGKSRLTQALQDWIGDEPHTRLLYQCSPHHTNSALYPIISQIERAAGFETGETADGKLDKLEALLAPIFQPPAEVVPLIAALLSIPGGERYPLPDLTPQQRKDRTLAALNTQLANLAAQQPVLFIFEDAHWIDPTSLELLELTVALVEKLQVLAVFTYRPEFVSPWTGAPHVTLQALNRLTARDCTAMAERLTGDRPLSPEILAQIAERTDGVPLFIEELTRSVLESSVFASREEGEGSAESAASIIIPATLQDALEARLDRSPAAREVAQAGAAIGREFPYELLARVVSLSTAELDTALNDLVGSGLIFARGAPPDARYTFKHALIQDTAYESLLISRRGELHRHLAETIEREFAGLAQIEPELLAHHFSVAGEADRAIDYWGRAGIYAVERCANHEAVAHLEKGLELIAKLPEGLERDQRELNLRLTLGTALLVSKGYAAPEVGEVYGQTRELCRRVGTPEQLFAATWGLWLNAQQGARLEPARSLSHELLEVADRQDQSILTLQAHHSAWTTLLSTAEFELCRQHSQQGRDVYDSADHRTHVLLYGGHDPGVCADSHLMQTYWLLGHLDQAVDYARDTITSSKELGHPLTSTLAHFFTSQFYLSRRDPTAARRHAEACIALSRDHGVLNYGGLASAVHGWAAAVEGDLENGIAEFEQGLEAWRRTGAGLRVPEFLAVLAEIQGLAGRPEQGLEAISEALDLVECNGEEKFLAEIHRTKGELLLVQSVKQVDASEACFGLALEIARQQQAKVFELRAAVSLARLQAGTGRRDQARGTLAPVYSWFTEGLDTPDLLDANALLDELS
jgi:class 3 adenylate cyclase/predicted ATPase